MKKINFFYKNGKTQKRKERFQKETRERYQNLQGEQKPKLLKYMKKYYLAYKK